MLTPSRTARTAAGWPATTGVRARVAGRLLTRLAASGGDEGDAEQGEQRRAVRDDVARARADAVPADRVHDHAEREHEQDEAQAGRAERARRDGRAPARAAAAPRAAITPPSAAQAGATRSDDAMTKPATVSADDAEGVARRGAVAAAGVAGRPQIGPEEPAQAGPFQAPRRPAQGSAISSGEAAEAQARGREREQVGQVEIGSSSEPALASSTQA